MKMRSILFFLIFIGLVLLAGCSPGKKAIATSTDHNDSIRVAIKDFSGKTKLFKKYSVFTIETIEPRNNPDIFIVSIVPDTRKMLLTREATIGSKGKLASRYYEIDGKLFFWWDDNCPLTEETLNVFRKFNLLQDDMDGSIKLTEFYLDDSQKAAHYYFCKGNFGRFKKVVTNRGLGTYDPPTLNCYRK